MVLWLGPMAGGVTTVMGLGGGLMLVLGLQAIEGDPLVAMAIASPALMIGNAHRAWLFRRSFPSDSPVAGPWLVSAGLGAAIGGLLAVAVEPLVMQVGMVLAAVFAVVRQLGWLPEPPVLRTELVPGSPAPVGAELPEPKADAARRGNEAESRDGRGLAVPWFLALAGFGVGLASTTGGAGLLAAPLLLALGTRGATYLALLSATALTMHAARIVSFGVTGAITPSHWLLASGLAGGIAVGNLAGKRIRRDLSERTVETLQSVGMAGMVGLALVGAT